jgi:hypothetical protein
VHLPTVALAHPLVRPPAVVVVAVAVERLLLRLLLHLLLRLH